MSVFDGVINVIEAVLLSSFIAFYFNISKKHRYILLNTVILSLLITYSTITEYYMPVVFICLTILLITMSIKRRKFTIETVIVSYVSGLIILFGDFFGMFLSSWLFNISTDVVVQSQNTYIIAVVSSKCFLAILVAIVCRLRSKVTNALSTKNWWILVLLGIIIYVLVFIVFRTLLTGIVELSNLIIVAIGLIAIAVLFIATFYRIQIENQEKMEYALEVQKHQFLSDNYNKIQSVSKQITDTEHRLMYVLLQVKGCLHNQDIEGGELLIDQYIKKIKQFDTAISTGNPYFDFVLSKKIDDYILDNKQIKVNFQIQKASVYDTKEFCDIPLHILEFMERYICSNEISLGIYEENQFIVIKCEGEVEGNPNIQLPNTLLHQISQYQGISDVSQIDNIVTSKVVLEV